MSSVQDGASNTFYAGETIKFGFIWDPTTYAGVNPADRAGRTLTQVRTGHGEFNPRPESATDVVKRNSYSSRHTGGANFVFVDGSTHFIAETIDHNRLTFNEFQNGTPLGTCQRLFSRNDGAPLDEY